jgi:hypothetical protein
MVPPAECDHGDMITDPRFFFHFGGEKPENPLIFPEKWVTILRVK